MAEEVEHQPTPGSATSEPPSPSSSTAGRTTRLGITGTPRSSGSIRRRSTASRSAVVGEAALAARFSPKPANGFVTCNWFWVCVCGGGGGGGLEMDFAGNFGICLGDYP
ncbi:hypothetical protein RHGRI_020117 [Rhododendron griersonianum]|uniref:Uncharacterized protein n=1 Tax=Rhododendron griersonianum TaxID=479676 RepID=A0AAV6JI17_9ERIC|nr:hypothetical protein RHGRI_020117 [Rhododendron griersonianum]